MSKGRKKVVQIIYWFSCVYVELYHTFLACAKKKNLKKKKLILAKKRIYGFESCPLAALAPLEECKLPTEPVCLHVVMVMFLLMCNGAAKD